MLKLQLSVVLLIAFGSTHSMEPEAVFENRSVSSFANASLVPVPSLELRLYL